MYRCATLEKHSPPAAVGRFAAQMRRASLDEREREIVAVSHQQTRGAVGGSLARALFCKQGQILRKSGLFVGVIRVNQCGTVVAL